MPDTILVIGDQDAQTKLLKNVSDFYAVKPFAWSTIPGQSVQGTINLEIGVVKGDKTLQIIAVPNDAEYALDQLMERSVGCIGVVNGRALTNQVANAISTLEELSIQHSKPCIVVTMDRDVKQASQPLHASLGISESVPVVHCKSSELATNFEAINLLNDLIGQEELRNTQIQYLLNNVAQQHGDMIQGAAIFDRNGTLFGSSFAENRANNQISFRFAALTNMCQQMLYVCGKDELQEIVIVGQNNSIVMYTADHYTLVFEMNSQPTTMVRVKDIAQKIVVSLKQLVDHTIHQSSNEVH